MSSQVASRYAPPTRSTSTSDSTMTAKSSNDAAKSSNRLKPVAVTSSSGPENSKEDKLGAHGAKVKHKRRFCRIEGCERIVKSQGLCQGHGAKPRLCKVEGCTKQAQGNFDGMCKSHFKEHKRKTTPIPAAQTSSHVVPTAEGTSVYDEILPSSVKFIPQNEESRGKMPLVEHLAEGFQTGKPPAWHRNEERKARGLTPIQNPATQLEGWERELVWMEILMLTGVPDVSFRHLARAWGRDKGFHMVLAQFICERHGDVERKKRKREEEQVAAIQKVVGSMASPPARPPPMTGAAASTAAQGQPLAKIQTLLMQQQGQSHPSRKLVVTKEELTEFRAAMMTSAPDRKEKIATLLRRRSSGSAANDVPLPDGIQEQIDALIGADVWDDTSYGDSNYNEELAADLFNLAADDSAILAKRMQNVANSRADDDSSTAYSRSEASTKQMLPPATAGKDAPGHYQLPKRESSASLYSSTSSNAQIPNTVAVKEGSEMEGGDTLGPSFATEEIGKSSSFPPPQDQQHYSGGPEQNPAQGFQQPPPHTVQNQDTSENQLPQQHQAQAFHQQPTQPSQVQFQSTYNADHQHNTSQTMQNDSSSHHHHQAQQQPPQYGDQNHGASGGTSDFSQILPQVQHRRQLSEPPQQGRSPHRRHLSEPPQQWGLGQIPPAVGHHRQHSYQGLPATAHMPQASQSASVGHPLLAQNKPQEGQAGVHGRLSRQNSLQGHHQRHHSQQGLALLANNAISTAQEGHGHPSVAPAPAVQRHQRNHSVQGFQLHGQPHPQNHQLPQQGHTQSISQHQGHAPAHSATPQPPQSLYYRQHSQGQPLHGQPLTTPGEHVQQLHHQEAQTTAHAAPTHQVQQANFAQAGQQVLQQHQSQNPHAQQPREHSHYEYDHERTEHLCAQDESDHSDAAHGDRDHGCEEIEEHHDHQHTHVHQESQQAHQVTQIAQASSEHSWNSFAAQSTASQGQPQQVHQAHQTTYYQQPNSSSQPSVHQTQAVAQHYEQVTPAPHSQGQQEQYVGHQNPSYDPAHSWNQPGGQAGAGQHGESSSFSHDQHANQHNNGNPASQAQAPQMQPFGEQEHQHGQDIAQQGFIVQNQPTGVPGYGQGESHGHFQGQQQQVTQDAYQIHPPNHDPIQHFDHEASSSNYGQGQHQGQALHHEAPQQGQHVADHPQDVATGYYQQEQGHNGQHQSGQPQQPDQPVYEQHSNQEQASGVNILAGPHQGQESNHEHSQQNHHQTGQSYDQDYERGDALFELPYTTGATAGSETEEQFDQHHPNNSFQNEHHSANGSALGNSEVTTHSWDQQGHEQQQVQHDPTQAQQQHQQESGQGHQDGQQTHHVFIEDHQGYPPESQNQHVYAEQQPQHGYGDHQQEGANVHQESQQQQQQHPQHVYEQQKHVSYVDEQNFVTVNGQQIEGYYDPSDDGAHQGNQGSSSEVTSQP